MRFSFFAELKGFLDDHPHHPSLARWREALSAALSDCDLDRTLELYDGVIEEAGQLLWASGVPERALQRYQALFREREGLIELREKDPRHAFVVVIPVADRPRQLRACLESLLAQLEAFAYGGRRAGRFSRVRVVIAEDSREQDAVVAHAALAREFTAAGLETLHFDAERQLAEWARLSPEQQQALEPVLGTLDPSRFWHKGPSRTRNLTYLLLARLAREAPRLLFLFLDSDEEFRVLQCSEAGQRERLAVNHFHHLDRLFRDHAITLLTGKVVGDPPVAPAVMAGNFLEDVIAFLHRLRRLPPRSSCHFHGEDPAHGEASYHDMAELFGFAPAVEPRPFRCPLRGAHDQRAAFAEFGRRLDRFFDGEHPTRVTCYEHQPVNQSLRGARTVYTGNYVVTAAGLEHFIPFATLRLRMAGPVLGRILRARLGDAFVSANLPLLHKRTLEGLGESEFRSGVERHRGEVDLSDEFERQFFGDVMLFSVEQLASRGYPENCPPVEVIRALVESTAGRLRARYREKQAQIRRRMIVLAGLLDDPGAWWNQVSSLESERAHYRRFLANMEANFGEGSRAWRRVDDAEHRRQWLERIGQSIARYPELAPHWKQALEGDP